METTERRLRNMAMSVIIITIGFASNMSSYGQAQPLRSFFEKKEGSYFGYEIAMGHKAATLHSDVRQLNSLRNSQLNTTLGVDAFCVYLIRDLVNDYIQIPFRLERILCVQAHGISAKHGRHTWNNKPFQSRFHFCIPF